MRLRCRPSADLFPPSTCKWIATTFRSPGKTAPRERQSSCATLGTANLKSHPPYFHLHSRQGLVEFAFLSVWPCTRSDPSNKNSRFGIRSPEAVVDRPVAARKELTGG